MVVNRSWGRGSGLGASRFMGKSNLGKRDWSTNCFDEVVVGNKKVGLEDRLER